MTSVFAYNVLGVLCQVAKAFEYAKAEFKKPTQICAEIPMWHFLNLTAATRWGAAMLKWVWVFLVERRGGL